MRNSLSCYDGCQSTSRDRLTSNQWRHTLPCIAGFLLKVGRRGRGERGKNVCRKTLSCKMTNGTTRFVDARPRQAARWLLLISKALLADINKRSPLGLLARTTKDQQVAAIEQVNVEFGVLFCLQFITRKMRWKPFNIVRSRQLKLLRLPRFWRFWVLPNHVFRNIDRACLVLLCLVASSPVYKQISVTRGSEARFVELILHFWASP